MNEINEIIFRIEFFSSFVEILLCIYFCAAFMEASKKKKYSVLTISAAFVLAAIVNIVFWVYSDNFIYEYKKRLLFFAMCVLVQWVYFHRKYFLAIVATIIYVEITMVVELAVELVLLQGSFLLYETDIVFRLCRILLITIGVLVLHGIVPKDTISPVYLLVVCLFAIVSILCNWMILGAEGQVSLSEEVAEIFLQSLLIVFFLFQIIVVFFVLKIAEGHQQKQTNALIELSNKMLQRSLDETEQTFELWRQSVHDYKNHVIVLKQMADEGRLDEIKSFLNDEGVSISKQLFMIRTGNSIVDTLVNIKHSLAEKHNIAFIVHGTLPMKLVMVDMDLANILGNLLDNAIEASIKEEDPYIDLRIKQEKNFLIISIRNKCTDISKWEIGKTSKENSQFHGIGLKSVKSTVKKYDGEMNIVQSNQEYIVSVMIQNKQEN